MHAIFTYVEVVLGVNVCINMPYMECLGYDSSTRSPESLPRRASLRVALRRSRGYTKPTVSSTRRRKMVGRGRRPVDQDARVGVGGGRKVQRTWMCNEKHPNLEPLTIWMTS